MSLVNPFIKVVFVACILNAATVWAESPQEMLETYRLRAKTEQAGFNDFSATRGQKLYNSTHANDWSCSTCHTKNPAAVGKHDRTTKVIDPLAPAANDRRFTRTKKVEKWFRRNCKDVLERECTAGEKGDLLSYLLTVEKLVK